MNSNKINNNSGWILCPSKRFPGKFYYYNVLNGESAWSFNDTEKKFLRIDNNPKLITQKWHCYPEPNSPPQGFTRNNLICPAKFGCVTFPQYIRPSNLKQFKLFENSIQPDLPSPKVMVQTCELPLSERFRKYQNYDNCNTYSTKINFLSKINEMGEVDIEKFKEKCNSTTMVEQTTQTDGENLFLLNQNSVENKTGVINSDSPNTVLAENDLRYILQAKRSKLSGGETGDLSRKTTAKKLRFNLNSDVKSDNNSKSYLEQKVETSSSLENKQIGEQDLKKLKWVVKNSNQKEMFLQGANEFNPFQLKNKNITTTTDLEKPVGTQRDEYSLNLFNNNQNPSLVPVDEAFNENVLKVTRSIEKKLYIKASNENHFVKNSNILFLKSSPKKNPFKKYRSRNSVNVKYATRPALGEMIKISIPNINAASSLFENKFKVPVMRSLDHKKVTSGKDLNHFDPICNSCDATNFNDNSISVSECTDDEKRFRYSNTNLPDQSNMKCCDLNKIEEDKSLVEMKLKNFYIKNKNIEKVVIIRMDEIICCFTQIMEDIIYDILETSTSPPPYSLYDAVLCLQTKFSQHTYILQIIDKLTDLDIFCPKTGYLKNNIYPHELVRAMGCGLIFIEAINELEEYDVRNSEIALLRLIQDVKEPQYVDMPEHTITTSRDDSAEQPERKNFIKKRSDIVTYLQNHFPDWKNYREEQDQLPKYKSVNHNVVITTGKDLHLLKINNKNKMYTEQNGGENDDTICNNSPGSKIKRQFCKIETFENKMNKLNTNKDILAYSYDISKLSETTHYNNQGSTGKEICNENNECSAYENLNFHETYSNKGSVDSYVCIETLNEIDKTIPLASPRADTPTKNDSITITDDLQIISIIDEGTNHSIDDANQYYLFVKVVLKELSSAMLSIHSFINDSIERLKNTEMTEGDKNELHEKIKLTYLNLRNIIADLKSIIDRETRNENYLRGLLIGADGASEDRRITNYRQVVAKCVEQARILASCLRMLLRVTDSECTLSVSSDPGDTCINIFE